MATEVMKKKATPKALESWDPLAQMRAEMSRLWNEPWGLLDWSRGAPRGQSLWTPRVDMFERGDRLVVKADLPGIKKDGIEVSLDNGDLVIRGERKEESESEGTDYYRLERSTGSFYRRIALPFEVAADAVHAQFEDGVLEVEIARPKDTKPHAQKIAVR